MKDYKIWTPSGWQPFKGVRKIENQETITITLENGLKISCTKDHKIYINLFDCVEAQTLKEGDSIFTKDGLIEIESIENNGIKDVFDVLQVNEYNNFYANDILVHNCEFIGQSNSLIDTNIIRQMLLDLENVTYKFVIDGDIRFYEDINPWQKYIIGVDTSMGVDGDFAAMQVFAFPSMIQVAEWQSDKLNQNLQVEKLKALTDWLYATIKEKGNPHPEVYWTLENNGSGEGFICALREKGDVHYIKRGTIINEKGNKRIGFTTTRSNKPAACSQLKILIETNKLKIRSRMLAVQLSNFSAKSAVSYSANGEGHDDLVMATVMVIMEYLQEKNRLDLNMEIFNFSTSPKEMEKHITVDTMPFIFNNY